MSKYRTIDREAVAVLADDRLGTTRSMTPEGFLLCENVPIARTGVMLYGVGETPVPVGADGIAYVTRDADALLNERTIRSFAGKPVTNDHPEVDVNPNNWKQYAVGIVLNPRQGEGECEDCIVGDLLITDAPTIRAINVEKKVEVSAGYDADYITVTKGRGLQANIIGNHVALVERGRCGPRCAVGDELPSFIKEMPDMGTKTQPRGGQTRTRRPLPEKVRQLVMDALNGVLPDDDTTTLEDGNGGTNGATGIDATNAPEDTTTTGAGGDTHIHLHTGGDVAGGAAPGSDVEQRLSALEALMEEILGLLQGGGDTPTAPEATPTAAATEAPAEETPEDDETPAAPAPTKDHAGDSAALQVAFDQLLADAEVLVPGYRMPTFDAKATRKATIDSMCAQRRRILDHLNSTEDGSRLLNTVGGYLPTMDCATTATVFRAAAGTRRLLNNSAIAAGTRDSGQPPVKKGITSIAELNAYHRQYYAGRDAAKSSVK